MTKEQSKNCVEWSYCLNNLDGQLIACNNDSNSRLLKKFE